MEKKSNLTQVSIDEAINVTSGTRKYQKLMVLICMLGPLTISPIIMCSYIYINQAFKKSSPEGWLIGGYDKNSWEIQNGEVLFRQLFFGGLIIGCLILPPLADIYGRKKVMKNYFVLAGGFVVLAAFSTNFTVLCVAAAFLGALYVAANSIAFVLCLESLDLLYRNQYLGIYQIMWYVASALVTAIYWSGLNWRYVILLSAGVLYLEIYLLKYVQESPRYLLSNAGSVQACENVLNKIARINGENGFDYTLRSEYNGEQEGLSRRNSIRSKRNIVKILVCGLMWFSVVFGYYSMVFMPPNKSTDVFEEYDGETVGNIHSIGSDILSIFSCFMYMILINHFGRKKTAFFSLGLDGAVFLSISILLYAVENNEALVFGLYSFARFLISGQFPLLYIYTSEQFPTYSRCTCLGICNAIGRTGGFLASFLASAHSTGRLQIILIIAGCLAIITTMLISFLEETHHKELSEIIENDPNEPLLDN